MQRLIIGLATVLVLGACGSGDDADTAATTDAPATAEASVDDTAEPSADADSTDTTDGADTTDQEAPSEEESADEPSDEESAEEPSDDEAAQPDDESDDDAIEIGSFSDLPPECVDLFRQFLRDIEPVVSTIDWQTATMSDFETLGADFDDVSDEFDAESTRLGCDRFDLSDQDDGIDEMIDFAQGEAPGTVPFLEFLAGIRDLVPDPSDDSPVAGAPTTCDEAVAAIEALVDEYGKMTNVPAGELARIGQIMSSLTSVCTIEELNSIIEREDIAEFLDG